uniref:N-acetylglucosaminylphosphatidylinositol deacetylase n=1 Tax=Cuerna arida TaxID=1464854 RepID=A0A1B6GUW1_9HEMI
MSNVSQPNVSQPYVSLHEYQSWLFDFLPEFVIEAVKHTFDHLLDEFDSNFLVTLIVLAHVFVFYCASGIVGYLLFLLRDKDEERIGQLFNRFFRRAPISQIERVLIVTAHPDDECMFFGPTIVELQKRYIVYLLCLTDGDYYGLGSIRKAELWESCRVLGMPDSHITLMKVSRMPDSPYTKWDPERTAEIIMEQVQRLDVNRVYTFDHHGVSGHPNHKSIYMAFAHLCLKNEIPPSLKVYLLESVNFIRKYTLFCDAGISKVFNKYTYMATIEEVRMIREAMTMHESQMYWFRWLYIYTTRYVYMNTYKELDKEDVILVAQINGDIA